MTLVTAQMSVSVDGFYAGPKHTDMLTWLARRTRSPAFSASPAGRSTPKHGANAWDSVAARTTPTRTSSPKRSLRQVPM